jgi:hypothetical protein
MCLVPAALAQQASTLVQYDVAFIARGIDLDPTCQGRGSDMLTGTLGRYERASGGGGGVYVGTLARTTALTLCGNRRIEATDTDVNCNVEINGTHVAYVMLTIRGGEGYLQFIDPRTRASFVQVLRLLPQPAVPSPTSKVSGTCDPSEMAQMEAYYDGGQTGATPSGQTIEVPSFPPATYPHVYRARPPVTTWALVVEARRP